MGWPSRPRRPATSCRSFSRPLAGFLPVDGRSPRQELRRTAPLLFLLGGVAVAALLVRVILFGGLAGEIPQVPLRGLGLPARAIAMLAVVPAWVRLLVWPAHLQAHYGPPELPVTPTLTAGHLLGLVLVLAIGGILWRSRAGGPGPRARPRLDRDQPCSGQQCAGGNRDSACGTDPLPPQRRLCPDRGMDLGHRVPAVAGGVGAPDCRGGRRAHAAGARGLAQCHPGRGCGRIRRPSSLRLQQDAPGRLSGPPRQCDLLRRPEAVRRGRGSVPPRLALYRGDPAVFEGLGQLYRIQHRCGEALPILEEGVLRHPAATVLRARTIECALAVGDTARAIGIARRAVDAGQTEFLGTLKRFAPAAR